MVITEQDYRIGSFSDVASDWGDRLWQFLMLPRVVSSMEEASHRMRPAAEPLGVELFQEFQEEVKANRVKQFIGFLIRQIMEQRGYRHEKYGVKTPNNPVFKSASLYCLRDQ